jgi:uracil phosphoribosyltransferase
MKVVNLGENNSVLNNFIAEIRDVRIQKDRLRFRTNMERVGAIFAYEISKSLSYSEKEVTTPLGVARVSTSDTTLVLAAILRAGLPLQEGFLNVFDHAESAFLATFRKSGKGDYFKVHADYCTCPSLEGKILILVDPLLATGASMEVTLQKLQEEGGMPTHIHMVCPIASRYAVDQLSQKLDNNYTLWVAAIDEELTSHNYIIPGMGDAGDLAFGEKL